jgi:hypothetical protein
MASISRSIATAALLAAFLLIPPAGAKEPEGGVFPGEKDRLPVKAEKDALGLLFGEADFFLASAGLPAEGFRVFWALRNPKGFSSKKVAGRAAPPIPPVPLAKKS